jgi:hypothetical protein
MGEWNGLLTLPSSRFVQLHDIVAASARAQSGERLAVAANELSPNEDPENVPQGAKAQDHLGAFSARLKSCPFKEVAQLEFFSKRKAPTRGPSR